MKKVRVCIFVIVCLFVSGLILMPSQAVAKDKVRLVLTTTSYAVWYNHLTIGLPKAKGGLGFYEEEGLDVSVTAARGTAASIKIVGAGKAEVTGSAGYPPIAAGIEQGMPVMSAFSDGLKNKHAIIVFKDSPEKPSSHSCLLPET